MHSADFTLSLSEEVVQCENVNMKGLFLKNKTFTTGSYHMRESELSASGYVGAILLGLHLHLNDKHCRRTAPQAWNVAGMSLTAGEQTLHMECIITTGRYEIGGVKKH